MLPYEYILNHVNVKISPSKINGVGLFALNKIRKNQILFKEWEGESGVYHLFENEINNLNEDVRSHIFDMWEHIRVEDKMVLSGQLNHGCYWIYKTPVHWVNSCGWNESPNVDRESLIALRDINVGEEILFKYGKYNKYNKSTII